MSAPNVREHVRGDGTPKVALSKQVADDHARRQGLDSYKCSICDRWHVGHKPWGRRWRFGVGSFGVSVRVWRERNER